MENICVWIAAVIIAANGTIFKKANRTRDLPLFEDKGDKVR